MSDTEKKLAKSRAIIASACNVLQHARQIQPAFGRELYASNADCYILLHDATKLFCQCLCDQFGEAENKRWSPAIPELLLSHPDKCGETLSLLERKDFKELTHFQFVAA
jgi:hypothetical protein